MIRRLRRLRRFFLIDKIYEGQTIVEKAFSNAALVALENAPSAMSNVYLVCLSVQSA
jgi:hypothetical protein